MKVNVYSVKGTVEKSIELPSVFEAEYRPDVIKRAVIAEQTWQKQPQGVSPKAGTRVSADSWGPGRGRSRVPRNPIGKAVLASSTVGGRRAHPPKAEKKIYEAINIKEYWLALKSALGATTKKELVEGRGHVVGELETFPIVLSNDYKEITKTSKALSALHSLGLEEELERAAKKKIRAGKGKKRGRKYRRRKGPLVVIPEGEVPLSRALGNIPGIDCVTVHELSIELLAPGTYPGRLTLWVEDVINQLVEDETEIEMEE
ncbi:MAG: 50S ribosomal protein L4 [Candidatus Kariarchaeaceae archaeon]